MSPTSSAVFPPSVFASVERPRPPIARFKLRPAGFFGGTGGGKPMSESEELSSDSAYFFILLSWRTCMSPSSSAVLPFSLFATVDNPRPPIAKLNPSPFGLLTGRAGGNP